MNITLRHKRPLADGRMIVATRIPGSPCLYVQEWTPADVPDGYYITDTGYINVRNAEWAIDLFIAGAR